MILSRGRTLMLNMMKWSIDMKEFRVFALAVLFVICSCRVSSNGAPQDTESTEEEHPYSSQINEVTVEALTRQDFSLQLLSNGRLSASNKSTLTFKESGMIQKIYVQNGQHVVSGTILATLEDSAQKSALESANIELDRATLDLQDVLVGLGYPVAVQDSVPESIWKMATIRSGYSSAKNSLEKAQVALNKTILRAPFTGTVANLKLKAWDMASSSEPICTIIGENGFDVDFTVLESEYPFVEKGQSVKVSLFSNSSDEFACGHITAINPTVDRNGQIGVRAHIPANPRMLDGMNVKVIVEKTLDKQFVVPKKAVVIRDGFEVLFRYNNKGFAEWVYVHILNANSESYAIVANEERSATLTEGDLVIVSGNLNLADGSKISIKQE